MTRNHRKGQIIHLSLLLLAGLINWSLGSTSGLEVIWLLEVLRQAKLPEGMQYKFLLVWDATYLLFYLLGFWTGRFKIGLLGFSLISVGAHLVYLTKTHLHSKGNKHEKSNFNGKID